MRRAGRVGSVFLGMALVLSLLYVSSAAAARLTSPSFQLDTNAGGTFGGSLSSTNYKMTAIGGEAAVGNGASGSYRLTQEYDTTVPSMQLSLQPSGLMTYFPFNENTGTVANDASATTGQATFTASPAWVTGKIGSALLFNGSSDTVTIPATAPLSGGQLTVMAWIKVASTTNAGTFQTILECQSASNNREFSIWINKTTGKLGAASSFGGASYSTGSNNSLNDGQWHHIVYTIDATRINAYVDGVLNSYTGYTGTLDTPTQTVKVAKGLFNGTVDEIKIFNTALTPQQISAAYTAQSSGVSSALSLGNLVSGSASSSTNMDAIVQTNADSYSLAISQDHDMQTMVSGGATPMATESFDNVPPSNTLTTSNTAYSSVMLGTSTTAVGDTTSPVHGTFARYTSSAASSFANGRFDFSATNILYSRFYFRLSAYPVGQSAIIMESRDVSAADTSNVKVRADGKISVSDGGNAVGTSAAAIPLNQWIRVEVLWDRSVGSQTMQLYYGANVDGATPDEVLTGAASNSSTVVDYMIGAVFVPKTNYVVDIDDTAISMTGWLGAATSVAGSNIPAVSGSITSPVTWSEGLTTGLGFSVTQSPTVDGRWNAGAKYAYFPNTATTFYTQPIKSGNAKDVVSLNARAAILGSQAQGAYSNTITVTGTTIP